METACLERVRMKPSGFVTTHVLAIDAFAVFRPTGVHLETGNVFRTAVDLNNLWISGAKAIQLALTI